MGQSERPAAEQLSNRDGKAAPLTDLEARPLLPARDGEPAIVGRAVSEPGNSIFKFLVGTAAVDLAAVILFRIEAVLGFSTSLVAALLATQLGLLGVWVGMSGRREFLLRSIYSGLACFVWWLILFFPQRIEYMGPLLLSFPAIVAITAIGMALARSLGVRLYTPADDLTGESTARPERIRFSLMHIFAWTTFVAIVAAVLSVVVGQNLYVVSTTLFYGTICGFLTWVDVWAAMSRRLAWRIWVPFLLPVAFIAVITVLSGHGPRDDELFFIVMVFWGRAIVSLGSLAVFRACGYRIMRRRQTLSAER